MASVLHSQHCAGSCLTTVIATSGFGRLTSRPAWQKSLRLWTDLFTPSATNIADIANAKPALLEYPTEIRLRIYKALFEGVKINLEFSPDLKLSVRDRKSTGVLRTSQQLRAEAMPVFHATAWFRGSLNVFSVLDAFGKEYGGMVDGKSIRFS